MVKRTTLWFAAVALLTAAGCATLGGAAIGTGIGALGGNARMGAAVGATTGAVIDIFGHR
ncbi:hypothetical protein [Methylomagnum sp.]